MLLRVFLCSISIQCSLVLCPAPSAHRYLSSSQYGPHVCFRRCGVSAEHEPKRHRMCLVYLRADVVMTLLVRNFLSFCMHTLIFSTLGDICPYSMYTDV